jgi:hypothetical protein
MYHHNRARFMQPDPKGRKAIDLGAVESLNRYNYARNDPIDIIDPDGRDIVVIEGGAIPSNPFGHTSIAISGFGVYSFGTGTDAGSSLIAFLIQQAKYRSSTVYVIKTTAEQDAAALAVLAGFASGMPGGLGRLRDNCSLRSNAALDAAHIPFSTTSGVGDDPPVFMYPNLPGSAGWRAQLAGASQFQIPQGTTTISDSLLQTLLQFEPANRAGQLSQGSFFNSCTDVGLKGGNSSVGKGGGSPVAYQYGYFDSTAGFVAWMDSIPLPSSDEPQITFTNEE